MFIMSVFGKTHLNVLFMCFISHLFWYLIKQTLFYIRKFLKIFGDLCWFFCEPFTLIIIIFLCFVFFYYILNLLTISVKCKYVKECFFFFLKKEQIIKSVKKNKKKDIEKLFFSSLKIQFLWIYSLASKSWISHFLSFVIFINARIENICDKCSRC
jgi:hypothetical protein